MKEDVPIYFKLLDSHLWIRLEGRGTFVESRVIREFVDRCLKEGAMSFVIDLEACPGMDSTFMGMLAGLAIQFRKTGDVAYAVIGTSEKTLQSLKELGLHHLLVINPPEAPWSGREAEARTGMSVVDLETVADQEAHIREAHENLCTADQSNLEKFATVLEMLGSKVPRP